MGPTSISPVMASPATVPLNSSVSVSGVVIVSFQATSLPLTAPSKISAELLSSPCVPVSVPPELFRLAYSGKCVKRLRCRPQPCALLRRVQIMNPFGRGTAAGYCASWMAA
jgi:hypothetical protein